MKVINWNLNNAKAESSTMDYLNALDGDILLLQEVAKIPDYFMSKYDCRFLRCTRKNGDPQRFGCAILVKGEIEAAINLKTNYKWANRELEFLKGNLAAYQVRLQNGLLVNIINVHSPAWSIPWGRLSKQEAQSLKLKNNPDVYGTEILYGALLNLDLTTEPWIVGGDFNSSETFDWMWGPKPRGNREITERMNSLGLTECLKYSQGRLTPTFKNRTGGKVIHQIDHVYVNELLISKLSYGKTADEHTIFGKSLSDHLPIITKFGITV